MPIVMTEAGTERFKVGLAVEPQDGEGKLCSLTAGVFNSLLSESPRSTLLHPMATPHRHSHTTPSSSLRMLLWSASVSPVGYRRKRSRSIPMCFRIAV